MRTFLLKNNIDKVASLNDQLWFYLFVNEEFNRDYKRFSNSAKALYTTDLFKDNQYSPRIDIAVSKIPQHQRSNQNVTCGIYFSTCYEILSQYVDNIFNTLKSFNSLSAYRRDSRKGPEENLQLFLLAEGLPIIDQGIIDTVTYLRLRRNHYTHIIELPNGKLEAFRITTGPSLNAFWASRGTLSSTLDFANPIIRDFAEGETIELIKLIRISMQEIDAHIAALLNIDSVISHVLKSYIQAYSKQKIKRIPTGKRIRKVQSLLRQELEITGLDDSRILPHVMHI